MPVALSCQPQIALAAVGWQTRSFGQFRTTARLGSSRFGDDETHTGKEFQLRRRDMIGVGSSTIALRLPYAGERVIIGPPRSAFSDRPLGEEAPPMTSETPDLQIIVERLHKLEAQNRRMKCRGIAILAALSAFVLMGQAAPVPRVVEAQKFVLKDANGSVRGWLGIIGHGSELTLGNADQQPRMTLMVSVDASNLHFFGSRKSGMTLGVDSGDPSLSMIGADGEGGAGITFGKDGPSLTLEDSKGFSTVLGSTQLQNAANNESQHRSAASVVLLDKDKKVMWRTP
jgi:hypothetical protein